jgi:hypothetical protein
MSFKKKIELILKAKELDKLSINKMEQALGLDGTIYKGVKNPDYIPDPNLVSEILRKYRIKESWWNKDWATGSLDMFEPKPTRDENLADNKENLVIAGEVYRKIVEGNTEYVLVPRTVLDNVQLIAKSQISRDNALMDKLLDQNEKFIARLLALESQPSTIKKGEQRAGASK